VLGSLTAAGKSFQIAGAEKLNKRGFDYYLSHKTLAASYGVTLILYFVNLIKHKTEFSSN